MEKFRLSMPTIIHFGAGEFERIKTVVKSTGKKAFIVTGQGSVKKNVP